MLEYKPHPFDRAIQSSSAWQAERAASLLQAAERWFLLRESLLDGSALIKVVVEVPDACSSREVLSQKVNPTTDDYEEDTFDYDVTRALLKAADESIASIKQSLSELGVTVRWGNHG